METPQTPLSSEILRAIEDACSRIQSPWLDMHGAKKYCCCSAGSIDNAVNAGHLKRHHAGGTTITRYHKDDLDQWMRGRVGRRAAA